MTRAVAYLGVAAAVISLILGAARRLDALRPGLAAAYTDDSGASPAGRALSRIDRPPFLSDLREVWRDRVPGAFGVTWTGQLSIPRSGRYLLAVNADQGTSLYVDGESLFDNVRHPEDQFASAPVDLASGPHAIFITYAHRGRDTPRLELMWALAGDRLAGVPVSALQPRRAGAVRVWLSAMVDGSLPPLGWIWAAELVAIGIVLFVSIAAATRRLLQRAKVWRELRWIVAASLALNATGIWWGLPAAWVPIELTPTFVLDGLAQRFSHGWFDAYPPLQYYVLSVAVSPLLVLRSWSGVVIDGVAGHTVMVLLFRLLSLPVAAGMVICACLVGLEISGRRAGLLAAASFALTVPFVFYAKTGNVDVPYLFWFSVSMVLFLRLVRDLRMADFVLFAAAAACAVCTKDQAYGFYVLVPLVVIERLWRDHRRRGTPKPFLHALIDSRIAAAAIASAVLFAAFHNFLFNFDGFKSHIAFIAGPGSDPYRLYPQTLAGRWDLLGLTVRLIERSMGWPLFLLGAAGAVLAIRDSRTRLLAICLLVPIVSYYVFFIDVVLYNYDRFVIPMCFVLAVFGGLALDRALAVRAPARTFVLGGVVAVFAYTSLYASTVDVLMLRDSRYGAKRWMREHIGNALVGVTELPELLPGMEAFRTVGISTIGELERERPQFVVLNVDYARAAERGTPWAALLEGLEGQSLGYRITSRFKSPSPWPWLPAAHPDLVGPRDEPLVYSVLRDINPAIDVLERTP